jgi:hypothetical protein
MIADEIVDKLLALPAAVMRAAQQRKPQHKSAALLLSSGRRGWL